MREINRVKIDSIIESQIPEFINSEYPLFVKFLKAYYLSQEYTGGVLDLANNITEYKKLEAFDNNNLISQTTLSSDVLPFDTTFYVDSILGWPQKYGLLKVDDEIITYEESKISIESGTANISIGSTIAYVSDVNENWIGREFVFKRELKDRLGNVIESPKIVSVENDRLVLSFAPISSDEVDGYVISNNYEFEVRVHKFENCIRGFSAIDSLTSIEDSQSLTFNVTSAEDHSGGTVIKNLSNLFLIEFFEKYKSEFLSGFEGRTFSDGISIENILISARTFYSSKGTDQSYRFLFKVLYGKDIELINPGDYTLTPSSNFYFTTKNVLVEKISGDNIQDIKGNFLYQDLEEFGTVSASIYNVEYRPIGGKDFYEISLDTNSFSGNFRVSGKTKILEKVNVGDDTILVDSTIGFAKSGTFLVKPENSNFIKVSYTDKTVNQFLGVTGVTEELDFNLDVVEDKFAYSFSGIGNTSILQFRLVNVIDNVDVSNTSNLVVGDKIRLVGFGRDLRTLNQFNSWIYNIPTSHDILKVDRVVDKKYRVFLYDAISFILEELVKIEDIDGNIFDAEVIDIEYESGDNLKKFSSRVIVEVLSDNFNFSNSTRLNKTIIKGEHGTNYFPNINKIPAGVQNTYVDSTQENLYITSTGLPNYQIFATDNRRSLTTLSVGSTDIFVSPAHQFTTGELLYFSPYQSDTSGISTGYYHVTVIDDNNISLSYSKSDIFSKKYIKTKVGLASAYVVKQDYENRVLDNQKLLKKIALTKNETSFNDENQRTTNNREIGILINGVELLSPTVFDENIFYGKIDSIEVTNSGSGYDVVNPPTLEILDSQGSDAKAFPIISGKLDSVKIISPGVGYQKKPNIRLIGGGGEGAILESNLIKVKVTNTFSGRFNVDTVNDTIDFYDRALFSDSEQVIYNSNGNANIPGLVSGSTYFVGIVSDRKIELYNTKSDSIRKVNKINLTGISSGTQSIESLTNKNTITEVYIASPGANYSNRAVKIPSLISADNKSVGINTFDSYIFANNHGFRNGDVVNYHTTDTPISGLNTTANYKITVVDENKFRLSNAGFGNTITSADFESKKYVRFGSFGIGTHTFAYPPIRIVVESLSETENVIEPVIEPIVLGSVDSVYVEQGGVSYGCTDIINFHRRPFVGISSVTSRAIIKPIIIGGSIVDIKIISTGSGFRRDSEILVNSTSGKYAVLKPTISSDGKLESVTVLNGGIGYDEETTTLTLINRGENAQFLANVSRWKINQVIKSSNLISDIDDGILYPTKNRNLGLKFVHFYVPKKLRYKIGDNYTSNNLESDGALRHSPIIGFAYDGNPIYGPYGYDNPTGGAVRYMVPGYSLTRNTNPGERPQTKPSGYFIEDYVFDDSGDLDINNGRFCITPEYPNGVYAYFQTINVDSSRRSSPRFPYIIGQTFKDSPIVENFVPGFNQDVSIFTENLSRNTSPYYNNFANSFYNLFEKVEDDLKQEFRVQEVETDRIQPSFVISPGDNYKIGDRLILDNSQSKGSSANIVVSEISGRSISNYTLLEDQIDDVKFIIDNYYNVTAKTSSPHGLLDGEKIFVTGISTITSSSVEGVRKIKVNNISTRLSRDLDIEVNTGLSTYIYVNSVEGISENDFLEIDGEKLLVLNVFSEKSALFVNRLENSNSHGIGSTVSLLPTKFNFDVNLELDDIVFDNTVTFFNPKESVGTGTDGVYRKVIGFANTTFESRFIPERSIYIPNHSFFTGQQLKYDCGIGGTGLTVNEVGSAVSFKLERQQDVYALNLGRNFIGLSTIGFTSTTGIGTNFNSLEFRGIDDIYDTIGAGHSLTETNLSITGSVKRITGIVTTTQPHNLVSGDIVTFDISPKNEQQIKIVYDFVNRKTLGNEFSFSDSEVSIETNEIDVSAFLYDIPTGSKVVYISQSAIGGLQSYNIYYVLRTSKNKIKLCNFESDISISNNIEFTSTGGSSQKIYFVNPPIRVNRGNNLIFDVSDQSLLEMDLDFYTDDDFIGKVEVIGNTDDGFVVSRDGLPGTPGAKIEVDTSNVNMPDLLYYSLVAKNTSDQTKRQLSIDNSVIGHNKIIVKNHPLSSDYEIDNIANNAYSFIIDSELEPFDRVNLTPSIISYSTKSESSKGPIKDLKINFPGRGFEKIPYVTRIESQEGKNGVVKIFSNKIGKIKSLDRIKDGFDYPTDPTLSPILTIPTVVAIKNIRTIDYIEITDGGKGYNTSPDLIVRGSNQIKLVSNVSGGSVIDVSISSNSTELSGPLDIIPVRNSNGYEIDSIQVNNNLVTFELLNDSFITIGYGNTQVEYPFKPGDLVFVENCRLTDTTSSRANFNSSSYDYQYFPVQSVSESNNTVTVNMAGISTGTFGTYDTSINFGTIVNKNDLAKFEMILKDDVDYLSKERVYSRTFNGRVMENGWDGNLNLLRITDGIGNLRVGDKLFGENSKVNGTVEFVDSFYLNSTLGVSREKVGVIDLSSGILNESQQKISDNFYYQKFAYSIKSEIPYDTWRESVRSTIHPSGFKEFSDLVLYSEPSEELVDVGIAKSTNLRTKLSQSTTNTFINIDSESSMYRRNNFATVYEEDRLPDGSVEDIFIFEGSALLPFIINKTNKVLLIDDISSQFNGTSLQNLRGRYADAADLLELNTRFIQEEVVGFITSTYSGITTNPDWDREVCKRDVGYVVDAIAHDLKYESNDKTVEAGLAYWNGAVNAVDGEVEETIAGFRHIIDLSKYIINNVGVKTTFQKGTPISIYNFLYDNVTGVTTVITTSSHGLSTTTNSIVLLSDIEFTYDAGYGTTTTVFPQLGNGTDSILDPDGRIYTVQGVGSTIFTFNPGISTVSLTYSSGGTVQKAFISTSQYTNNNIIPDSNCSQVYSENCCADVWFAIGNYVGIVTSIISIGTTAAPLITYPSKTRGGQIVGLTSFKLKSSGNPLFKLSFNSSLSSIVNVTDNKIVIPNHNLQTGQELIYDYGSGSPVGIATTSFVFGNADVLMTVGNFNGSAILEDGINSSISTSITGTSVISVGNTSLLYLGVPGTNGVGIATFNVFVTYDSGSGQPLSTSIILKDGGNGFSIGDTVSIAGTYLSGSTPQNDLSFVVSNTGVTKIQSESNSIYSSVPSTDQNSIFDVIRDFDGFVSSISVVSGGSGYNSNSVVSIAGTYIGGSSPNDDVSFTPTELGSNIMPQVVYVNKLNDNEIRLTGISTGTVFDFTSLGVGIHTLTYKNANSSVLVTIDGIIQSPLTDKNLSISLGSTVATATTTVLDISSGISSLRFGDIINIGNEYMSVKNIGVGSVTFVDVERAVLGSVAETHPIGYASTVLSGDFNIVDDVIYFTSAPYGKIGPVGLETGSTFAGRVFSRTIDGAQPNDKNIILDDISLGFTGVASTEFVLKSEKQTTQVLFNDLNFGSQINNNPFILVNNVLQVPNKDYFIDNASTNTIRFISGVPKGGRISAVGLQSGFGYSPLIGASAQAVVSAAGTISEIVLTGSGSGYRNAPFVSVGSTIGFGASVTANISVAGTVTGFNIVNPGTGYTTNANVIVTIGIPTGYSNLGLEYIPTTSGEGRGAKVSVSVGQGSSIISFRIDNPGDGYKVGDVLNVPDLLPIAGIGTTVFEEFRLTVTETENDKFSGFFPGQCLILEDIAPLFNGVRTKFTLKTNITGTSEVLTLRTPIGSDLNVDNNIFVFINDILQVPGYSYTIQGSRIFFTEPPKSGSICTILYYRGSSNDIEFVNPPKFIKEGDIINIKSRFDDPIDRKQFPRTIKTIASPDTIKTFPYGSIGIVTDNTFYRPADYKKQLTDTVINGKRISKARPTLTSNVKPTANLIAPLKTTDISLYVDNAFPIFTEVDRLTENLRDVDVIEFREIDPAIGITTVSTASTISRVDVVYGGVGYAYTLSPKVSFSESRITKKDPIYDWNYSVGIPQTYQLNSVTYEKFFVAVGEESALSISFDGDVWTSSTVGFGTTVGFKSVSSVGLGTTSLFVAVGDGGPKVAKSFGDINTLYGWSEIKLYDEITTAQFGVTGRRDTFYTGTLNDIVYSPSYDTFVTVGTGGSIFVGTGISTESFVNRFSQTLSDLTSVAFEDSAPIGSGYFLAVGSNGTILSSSNGQIWDVDATPAVVRFNKVIYANNQFVIVGDNGTVATSKVRGVYQKLNTNITVDLINIDYLEDGIWIALDSSYDIYYSFDLEVWIKKENPQSNNIKDYVFAKDLSSDGKYVFVGSSGTSLYSEPVLHRAEGYALVSSGVVTSIVITDGGFGYDPLDKPPVLVEQDGFKKETIVSIKAEGDFGDIIGINTFLAGNPGIGTTTPKIEFVLKSDSYDNSSLGIGYSSLNSYGVLEPQLQKGDYFVITDSNVEIGHDLIGITTLAGGMSNYPNSKVGIAKSFLDGVYRVEDVTEPVLGIVTVTCNFAPRTPNDNEVQVYVRGNSNSGVNTNNYYGRYSWGKIFDFQNRINRFPENFDVNVDNGMIGIRTGPIVTRTRPLLSE